MPIEILYVILGIIIFVAVVGFSIVPMLLIMKNRVYNYSIDLEEAIKKKWLIVPKFIELVKPLFTEKREVLEELILLRNTTFENMDFFKKVSTNREIERQMGLIISEVRDRKILETEKFLNMFDTMKELDDNIYEVKELYNQSVYELNRSIESNPRRFFAKLFKIDSDVII